MAWAVAVAFAATLFLDGRDDRTLLAQPLLTHELFEQLETQPHRRGRLANVALAADGQVGSQIETPGAHKTPWHGYQVVDGHLGVRLVDGLDANVNLVAFNMSASAGWRGRSDVLPGLAIHLHPEVAELAGEPVRLGTCSQPIWVGLRWGRGCCSRTNRWKGTRPR